MDFALPISRSIAIPSLTAGQKVFALVCRVAEIAGYAMFASFIVLGLAAVVVIPLYVLPMMEPAATGMARGMKIPHRDEVLFGLLLGSIIYTSVQGFIDKRRSSVASKRQ